MTGSAAASRWSAAVLGIAVGAVMLGVPAGAARAGNRDALWHIVHDRCVPDQLAHGDPAPCVSVVLSGGEASGSAALKDRVGATQFLLIPTARIGGIESPAILRPDAPNYFARAWALAPLVDARLGHPLPPADLSLAINSAAGRSQDQLHIHVDCLRADVRAALDRNEPAIGTGWHELPERLSGHRYRALRLFGVPLGSRDPFRLLAASLSDPAREMAAHTLVLVGDRWHGRPGFLLLDGGTGPLSGTLGTFRISPNLFLGAGSGEELQDHDCGIARPPQPDPPRPDPSQPGPPRRSDNTSP